MKGTFAGKAGAWVLRSRWHASATLSLLFTLGWLAPPLAGLLFVLCSALIMLIALEIGSRGGLEVAVLSAVAVGLLALNPALAAGFLLSWLPAWILGESSRRLGGFRPLAWVLLGLGAAVVALAIFGVPGSDTVGFWRNLLNQLSTQWAQNKSLKAEDLTQLARFFPGLIGSSTVMIWLLALLLARWTQARLPAHVEQDAEQAGPPLGARLQDFSTPRVFLGLVALLLLLLWTDAGQWGLFALGLTLVLAVLYLFQGLALFHAAAQALSWPWHVTAVFYVTLLVFAQSALLVCVLGVADALFELKNRVLADKPDHRNE